MSDAALASAWSRQGTWSAAADQLKRSISRSRTTVLALVTAAAAIELLAAGLLREQGPWSAVGRGCAGAGAAMLAAAALVRSRTLGVERVRDWIRARSASEALKAAVYQYLTGTGDYSGKDAARALSGAVDRVTGQVQDLEVYAAGVRPSAREPPPRLDLAGYVRQRVEAQIEGYYQRRAADLARRLKRFRRIELALTLAASALGALGAVLDAAAVAAWVAALTTMTGAVAAHIEASRDEHLIVTYRGTARRLEALRDRWRDELQGRALSAGEATAFVKSCEDAISVENEAWMADWTQARS